MNKEAMKLALEALKIAQNNLAPSKHSAHAFGDGELWDMYADAIKVLEEALAKQEQGEPVAWMRNDEFKAMTDVEKQAWIAADDYWSEVVKDYTIPLYTTPQQRKPLTDEQFQAICNSLSRQGGWDGDGWDLALKEAIEAAHGIKE